jgi:hypothetical protein
MLIVAVAEEEIGLVRLRRVGRGLDRALVRLRGMLIVLRLVGGVRLFERLARLNFADLAAAGHRERPEGDHGDKRRRWTRQTTH